MNSKALMITGGVILGVAALLAVAEVLWERKKSVENQDQPETEESPYTSMIQKTLQTHQGEETPFVRAFEEALEEEDIHEKELMK